MALIRWEPFPEVDTLQRQMNRLFDNLIQTPGTEERGLSFTPAAEIEEIADALHLRVELPGLSAQDIDVQVTAEAVAISGERQAETKTTEKQITRSEFRYGKFQRLISLPVRIQHDQVQADYKNGVLTLNLPKAEAEKHKVVKVNIA